ncbi:hypothetical protein ABEB36_012120 [Hypothenemus hampei]|uniref:non-specific serine/threonine protein kinase n=1 Tax=Hypothenemus hampei TaxID=57062 RepID=A0ABD1EA69_HYPHA
MPQIEPQLEIRKLHPSITKHLCDILDCDEEWKKLMALIPKQLSQNGFKCDIAPNNLPKYTSEHFKIIESGSVQYQRSCTGILFEEWGTSGRPRASVGHLKYLLTKANLFRAADYVAELLGEGPVQRPSTGPAARIPTSLPSVNSVSSTAIADIERQLNEINYPQAAIQEIKSMNEQLQVHAQHATVIPKIVVSEDKPSETFVQVPIVVNANEKSENSLMDGYRHSSSSSTDELPDFSQLLLSKSSGTSNSSPYNNPDSTEKSFSSSESPSKSTSSDNDLISELLANIECSNDDPNIPLTVVQFSQRTNTEPRKQDCLSGNLFITNTEVPHYSYQDLEIATNHFCANEESGRFLGSGGFGSVFLATGLFSDPVAVKKFTFEHWGVDKIIRKQFINEIDILSKYKHENLVTLLGYSCDGPCYCLVYEYVVGGSLFDTLRNRPKHLPWKQRLTIALGTAKAIAYLNTAFETPLIHRDLKSANILLDKDNNAKLCDFGIARLLPEKATNLNTEPFGTSAYMPSEYHMGEVTLELDTFSFGVILLELLTSLPPLDEERPGGDLVTYVQDYEDNIDTILDKTVGNWHENDKNFAEELYKLALKCLEDRPLRPVMTEVMKILESLFEKLMR